MRHLPCSAGVGDIARVEDAVQHLRLRVLVREDFNLRRANHKLPPLITFWLCRKHLRVHLEEHLKVFNHGLVRHHVRVKDGLDAVLPDLLILLLGQVVEDIGLWFAGDRVELRAMHVLQGRPVVVLHGQLMANFREKAVVHARMSNVMANGGDKQRELFQFRKEASRGDATKDSRHSVEHVNGVREAMKGNRQVLLLNCRGEALEHGNLISRVHETVAVFVELAHGEHGEIHTLTL
mmetsp:Transcript_36763/g.84879  ORF Transcript_36763/g.84879 Transcript_36763/m.84879 type:complete len:236 (-) Transcript_36763:1680-2387(-)